MKMGTTIEVTFEIIISDVDAFIKNVADYGECDVSEVTGIDIAEYLEDAIEPAHSLIPTLKVVGSDEGGYFVQYVDLERIAWYSK